MAQEIPLLIPINKEFAERAHITEAQYAKEYARSIARPEEYWGEQAKAFRWQKPWNRVKNTSFKDDIAIRWFEGGACNMTENCLDRHLNERGEKPAIVWEADNPATPSRQLTYRELHREVCKLANVLLGLSVKRGDRVSIYLPMIPEAAISMLACARIGAVHSVVFGGFSAEALRGRIADSQSVLLITADEGRRVGKAVPLKAQADKALSDVTPVQKMLVVKHTGGQVEWQEGRDIWWHKAMDEASAEHAPVSIDAEAPLFILYTSGSTGKPKGIMHTTGGYMVYAALTHKLIFDLREEDVYWCTADVGWVTGHSYIVYGPLLNGATTMMFEGVPNYPDHSRFWQVIDKHKVTLFYTAPTVIRALMREGNEWVKRTSRASLRLLASVGEPINPEAWRWYHEVVGDKRCPVVDTWWQTETGGILIAPLAGAMDLKPGSASRPFFGIEPVMLEPQSGVVIHGEGAGVLAIADSWPGQARSIYGDHARFYETYFSQYPGYYFTGDGCRRDADGDWWITGRVDDVLNVSGHRIGTAEVESALVTHDKVAEAAVVGAPHNIKGQAIYAFVMLNSGEVASEALIKELRQAVRADIGPIATPDFLQVVPGLPKTRSGKIMRRILRKIAENDFGQLGDTSTLLNPEVVQLIIDHRLNA